MCESALRTAGIGRKYAEMLYRTAAYSSAVWPWS